MNDTAAQNGQMSNIRMEYVEISRKFEHTERKQPLGWHFLMNGVS